MKGSSIAKERAGRRRNVPDNQKEWYNYCERKERIDVADRYGTIPCYDIMVIFL